jgi:DNA-binding phage protein
MTAVAILGDDKNCNSWGLSMAGFEARERLAEALHPLTSNNQMRAYARSIQVSSNTVAKWLACESFPSGGNVSKVAQSLGMTLDDFNSRIIEGRNTSRFDPTDQAISILYSLPPSGLSRVLRAVAERLELYEDSQPRQANLADVEPPATCNAPQNN